jgi:SAM-dependent methyltransferase
MFMEDRYSDGDYLTKNPTWHVEDSPWKARQIVAMMRKHGLEPTRIAEVGCGAGAILTELSAAYPACSFVGYEMSPQAMLLCKSRETDRVHFRAQNIFEFAEEPYDVILCIDVIEHIDDSAQFLQSIRQLQGLKIFHIPLELSVLTMLKASALVDNRRRVGHVHFYSKELAIDTVADSGLQVLDWCYTPWALDYPSRNWKAALLNGARGITDRLSRAYASRLFGGYSLLVLAK